MEKASVYSDNCEACGGEELSSDLLPVKIGSLSLNLCAVCINYSVAAEIIGVLPQHKYLMAANILKSAQQPEPPDPELQSPQVRIEPQETLIDKAVQKLKQMQPNYFIGVRKIVSGPESHYGHVTDKDDPAIIHINFPRIKSEVEKSLSGMPKEQVDEEIINKIVSVLAHEAGHVKSYDKERGFVGNEAPAIAEENRINNLNKI
jgi:hypothetical protein